MLQRSRGELCTIRKIYPINDLFFDAWLVGPLVIIELESALTVLSAIAGAIDFEKASWPESAQGFVPVAKRWVVERTIAWTNFFRRIIKDYEYTPLPLRRPGSVSWLYLADIQIML